MDIRDQESIRLYVQNRRTAINRDVLVSVSDILEDVRNRGDVALSHYSEVFDGVVVQRKRVDACEMKEAAEKADPFFVECMEKAKKNIEEYHTLQIPQGYHLEKEMGIYMGQRVFALDSVGVYVPGGRAQYPSTVLMNVIPAKLAGVKRIVMITPPDALGGIHPNIAAAARLLGIDEVYKVGGAQGIAALAYGTASIPCVDKIVGPGNIYVATAKKLVYGVVDIDMIAGPSEILVVADASANPAYVAADLLSQAEHDPLACSMLLSTSKTLMDNVDLQLQKQSATLPKKAIIQQSLQRYGIAIQCGSIEECIHMSNEIAPEHLELMLVDAKSYLAQVTNAGSVFLGYQTCESIGDYFGGTNHVLPTSGTARFASPLGVDSFMKKASYLHYSEEAVHAYGDYIMEMAQQEELMAHANAVRIRMKQ